MKVELHCHSTCSDGSLPAHEVGQRVAKAGVELFCLTDHDTMNGYEDAARAAQAGGVKVLRGLELSARAFNKTVHMLVYGVQEGPGKDALESRLEVVRASRRERLKKIAERLQKLGITIDAETILKNSAHKTVGRPDVARALVEVGAVSSMKEAFTRFLRDGGPADVPVERVSVPEGLALAKAAGAKCSLAHPHTLDHALVTELFSKHRDEGFEGIEVYYGRYGKAQREGWRRLAEKFELVQTGGSDFHGDAVPDVTRFGVELPEAVGARLVEWLGIPG